jgi:hypothetical protein
LIVEYTFVPSLRDFLLGLNLAPQLNTASPRALEDIIQAGFAAQPLTTNEAQALPKCSSTCCPPIKAPILVDRLPPVFILTEDNLEVRSRTLPGLFTDVPFHCTGTLLEQMQAVWYRTVGYIVSQGVNHFTLCWQRRVDKAEYFQSLAYDGLANSGKFVFMPSLTTAYPKGASKTTRVSG